MKRTGVATLDSIHSKGGLAIYHQYYDSNAIFSREAIIHIRGFVLLQVISREMFFVERTQPVNEYPHSGRQLPVLRIKCRK